MAQPILDGVDVSRLAAGLGISEDSLAERMLVDGEESDSYIFNAKPCPLLKDKKCTAYDSRPNDCRSFPHLHKKEFVFRLIRAIENCSICPIVYNVFEELKKELWHQSESDWDDDSAEF